MTFSTTRFSLTPPSHGEYWRGRPSHISVVTLAFRRWQNATLHPDERRGEARFRTGFCSAFAQAFALSFQSPCTFVEDFGGTAHHQRYGGRFVNSATLKPVARKGYWRVQMAWPNNNVHFFGKFLSQAEAERWIEQHRWLTQLRQKPDVTSRDKSNDR